MHPEPEHTSNNCRWTEFGICFISVLPISKNYLRLCVLLQFCHFLGPTVPAPAMNAAYKAKMWLIINAISIVDRHAILLTHRCQTAGLPTSESPTPTPYRHRFSSCATLHRPLCHSSWLKSSFVGWLWYGVHHAFPPTPISHLSVASPPPNYDLCSVHSTQPSWRTNWWVIRSTHVIDIVQFSRNS